MKINHSDGNSLQKRISRYLESVYNISNGPNQADYDAALCSIINVQYVYNLAAKDIASGFLNGINTKIVLNARDCFLLGQFAVFMTFYRSGMQWLEYALHLKQNKSDVTIQLEQVSDALAQAKIAHDKRYSAQKWDNTRYFRRRFAPLSEPTGTQKIHPTQEAILRPPEVHYITKDTHGICQGRVQPSPDETKELFCCPYQGHLRARDIYVGEELSPETHGVLRQIVERISGLRVPDSSGMLYDLHVLSHTAGDYYPAHLDTDEHPTALATFLIYFSEVSKGGESYFLDANLKTVPKKGSAVMTYNLYSCGQNDESALHGFCPISFGEKWVTPVWIMYEHQTHLQCLSEPYLRHEILVNGQSKYKHQNEHR
ncbi:unnamed protein product [Allacma fusca]|uniref:Fe2OG dioxygenase domain-containing protein n=1 Tax=Allacma fusca TaxID=39272 RepID=A0A8J2LDJ3_9HEXA|nr:unnamed protein product [Allacma fusca]